MLLRISREFFVTTNGLSRLLSRQQIITEKFIQNLRDFNSIRKISDDRNQNKAELLPVDLNRK